MRLPDFALRTQLVLLVGTAFFAGQVLGLVLFADERSLAIQTALGVETAGRAANVAQLIESAPPELREQIVQAANSPLVRFEIGQDPHVGDKDLHEDPAVEARVRALMDDSFSRAIRVEVHEIESGVFTVPNILPDMAAMHANMMRGTLAAIELEISIALSGGDWLNVGTRFERPPWQISSASLISLLLSVGLGALAVFWFVIVRITRPLSALTHATEAFGRGSRNTPIEPAGPPEVKALARAFNVMQARLRRFVSDRTMMLAALAHDLRSPITAMRVQSAMVDDAETQASLGRSLDEMSDMVEATLAYAKGVGAEEDAQQISIADLLIRAGAKAGTEHPHDEATISVRVTAMTRALRNLIENADRYGGGAELTWRVKGNDLEIFVNDTGPGIPADQIEDVFEPYVRLEQSRSRETGGNGLGLSIARSIVLAHGGTIELKNRSGGGLQAIVSLPDVVSNHTQSEHTPMLQNYTSHPERPVVESPSSQPEFDHDQS